jgi:hypothetical protein
MGGSIVERLVEKLAWTLQWELKCHFCRGRIEVNVTCRLLQA